MIHDMPIDFSTGFIDSTKIGRSGPSRIPKFNTLEVP